MIIAQPHLAPGDRAKVHPATDLFMCGVRYVTIDKIGRKYAHVTCERSSRTFKIPFHLLERI